MGFCSLRAAAATVPFGRHVMRPAPPSPFFSRPATTVMIRKTRAAANTHKRIRGSFDWGPERTVSSVLAIGELPSRKNPGGERQINGHAEQKRARRGSQDVSSPQDVVPGHPRQDVFAGDGSDFR